jgi:hypothetical protein
MSSPLLQLLKFLPACLTNTWDLAIERELAEAETAHTELAVECA